MKRILSLVLIAALVAGLPACGKKEKPAEETTAATAVTTAPADTETAAATEAETAETAAETETVPEETKEAEAEVRTPEEQSVALLHVQKEHIATGKTGCLEEYEKLVLCEEDACAYPELAAALDDFHTQQEYQSKERLLQLQENYEELKDYRDEDFSLTSEIISEAVRADEKVLSIFHDQYIYLGGAHPDYLWYGDSFDTETGKHLIFTDVVTDPEKFFDLTDEKLKEQYADIYDYMNDFTEYRQNLSYEEYRNVCWTVDYEGVTVYFNPYELGPFAMGAQVVKVLFSEAPEVFSDRFTAVPDHYMIPFLSSIPLVLDVTGHGKQEEIRVEPELAEPENEYCDYYNYRICAGKRSVLLEHGCYSEESYILYSGGKHSLYLFEQSDNDYILLSVVDLSTMEYDPEKMMIVRLWKEYTEYSGEDDGYVSIYRKEVPTDPSAFRLMEHCDLLGTKSGVRRYHAGEDGYPVKDEAWITFRTTMALKARKEVSCEEVSPEGKVLGDAVIPEGTCLCFVRSDNESWVDVQEIPEEMVTADIGEYGSMVYTAEPVEPDDTKPLYRLYPDSSEWPYTVNGIDENELFYGVAYAG